MRIRDEFKLLVRMGDEEETSAFLLLNSSLVPGVAAPVAILAAVGCVSTRGRLTTSGLMVCVEPTTF